MHLTTIAVLLASCSLPSSLGFEKRGSDQQATQLSCEHLCNCTEQTKGPLAVKEYRIICNSTDYTPVILTREIFSKTNWTEVYQIYVRVENFPQLTVTSSFVQSWKKFGSCSLDVWKVTHVTIEEMDSSALSRNMNNLQFAGIGIFDGTLDSFPDEFFTGKGKAGFRLIRTNVGVLHSGLFEGVRVLKYLQIENSTIGIMQGPKELSQIKIEKSKLLKPYLIQNSTFGKIEQGALSLISDENLEVILDNVTIGELQTNAIDITYASLIFKNSRVANMHAKAINVHGLSNSVKLRKNKIIAQPGALNHLRCDTGFKQNHIIANEIIAQTSFPQKREPASDYLINNETRKNITVTNQQPTIVDFLLQVLHPSCIDSNLPQWFSSNSQNRVRVVRNRSTKSLQIGLYSFIGISILGMILVCILVCILINTRKRYTHMPIAQTPPVIMSHLQEPDYEEPSNLGLPCQYPPVPAPFTEKVANQCTSSMPSEIPSGCNGNDYQDFPESTYLSMR